MMHALVAIFWKETRVFAREGVRLLAFALLILFIAIYFSSTFRGAAFTAIALNSLFAGIYFFSWVSYYSEKRNKAGACLVASPIRISDLILGKTLAIFIASYAGELVALTISICCLLFNRSELPRVDALLPSLVLVPIWGVVLIELFAVVYLYTGRMMVVQFLGILMVTSAINPSIVAPTFSFFRSSGLSVLHGVFVALLLGILASRIGKERIAKTLS